MIQPPVPRFCQVVPSMGSTFAASELKLYMTTTVTTDETVPIAKPTQPRVRERR